MGTHKFKLSEFIPSAWFYKLKIMTKPPATNTKLNKNRHPTPLHPPSTTTPPPPPPESQSRKSYHFTRVPTLSVSTHPRKSKSKKPTAQKSPAVNKKHSPSSTVSGVCSTVTSPETTENYLHQSKPKKHTKSNLNPKGREVFSMEDSDIVIDVDNFKHKVPAGTHLDSGKTQSPDPNYSIDFKLSPIITDRKQVCSTPSRRFPVGSPAGVRLKMNSPRIMGKKQGQDGNCSGGRKSVNKKKRRSLMESFAVVKSSDDPERDFRESMVEMIVGNNIKGSKELEDLLACYLSLNSDEYHGDIIKVFKQIWYDFSNFEAS